MSAMTDAFAGRAFAALDHMDCQLIADSDEVVLPRDSAETIVKAFEIQTSYIARLEELLDRD